MWFFFFFLITFNLFSIIFTRHLLFLLYEKIQVQLTLFLLFIRYYMSLFILFNWSAKSISRTVFSSALFSSWAVLENNSPCLKWRERHSKLLSDSQSHFSQSFKQIKYYLKSWSIASSDRAHGMWSSGSIWGPYTSAFWDFFLVAADFKPGMTLWLCMWEGCRYTYMHL